MLERLKQLREEKHLNQEGLGMKLNISQSTISAYERGERVPDIETATIIADYFDVSIDYLLGRSEVRKIIPTGSLSALESNIVANLQKLNVAKQQQVDAFIKGMLA